MKAKKIITFSLVFAALFPIFQMEANAYKLENRINNPLADGRILEIKSIENGSKAIEYEIHIIEKGKPAKAVKVEEYDVIKHESYIDPKAINKLWASGYTFDSGNNHLSVTHTSTCCSYFVYEYVLKGMSLKLLSLAEFKDTENTTEKGNKTVSEEKTIIYQAAENPHAPPH